MNVTKRLLEGVLCLGSLTVAGQSQAARPINLGVTQPPASAVKPAASTIVVSLSSPIAAPKPVAISLDKPPEKLPLPHITNFSFGDPQAPDSPDKDPYLGCPHLRDLVLLRRQEKGCPVPVR